MHEMTPFQFLETIFRQPLRHGQLMLWSKIRRSGRTMTDWCYSLKQATRQVEHYRNRRQVCFGVAFHDRQKALDRARQRNYRATPARVRGSEESVTALPALWAELAGGPDLDRLAMVTRIAALSPPPSMVVWTGAAYQVYWLLARAWVLADEDHRRQAQRLLARVQWALASAGGRRPGSPAAGDPAGLMQVAGTFHHLGDRRFPVVVERPPRQERWTAGDFEHLEDPPRRARAYPWSQGQDADQRPADADARRPLPGQTGRPGDLQPVWDRCSWLRHCYHRQATLSEGEWAAALSIVGRCQAGPDHAGASLARSFSHRHPGYLPTHTDRQLERVLNDKSGPARCRRIGGALGAWDGHCSHCPHQGRVESPIDLGRRAVARSAEAPAGGSAEPQAAVVRPAAKRPSVPLGGTRGEMRPTAGRNLEIEVVLRLAPGAGSPVRRPLVEAALACLREAATGDGGSDPAAAGEPPAAAGPSGGPPRPLLDGLEGLVAALGAPVTARRIVETLAAEQDGGGFDRLRSGLRHLFPDLDGLPTARQLGCALRSCARAAAGERRVVAAGRNRQGTTWAVHRAPMP